MEKPTVLFVDDEEHILTSLKRLLRKEPYKVLTAVGGEAGLEVIAAHPEIQMVVSDQRMPGMCGTEFLAKVKEANPETMRLVLSGFAEASAIVDAINEGEVYRFIAKPWDDEKLKAIFRQCLDHFQVIQENKQLQVKSEEQLIELQRLNGLLESSVEDRTRSLSLSQEVLDTLPMIVLGISQEEEVVLVNDTARTRVEPLRTLIPGTDIEDVLPAEAVNSIRASMTQTTFESFDFNWEERSFRGRLSRLGSDESPRGCVLVLEEN